MRIIFKYQIFAFIYFYGILGINLRLSLNLDDNKLIDIQLITFVKDTPWKTS